MKRIIAATLFCATLAIPAVAQGPHMSGGPKPAAQGMSAQAANLVPVAGAVAAPVAATALYGGDLAGPREDRALPSGPSPSIAWVLALGFLGLVVMRRTRSSASF